jgi:hypothetical protein
MLFLKNRQFLDVIELFLSCNSKNINRIGSSEVSIDREMQVFNFCTGKASNFTD